MLRFRRFIQPGLQRGVGGDQIGTITGFLSGSEIGAPFNGGTLASGGATADTDEFYASAFSQFLLVVNGNVVVTNVTWTLRTHDPDTLAVLFSDSLGTMVNGALTRFTFGGFLSVRPDDTWIVFSIRATNTGGNAQTGLTARLWGSRR